MTFDKKTLYALVGATGLGTLFVEALAQTLGASAVPWVRMIGTFLALLGGTLAHVTRSDTVNDLVNDVSTLTQPGGPSMGTQVFRNRADDITEAERVVRDARANRPEPPTTKGTAA